MSASAVLPNSAVTVALGHMMMASDIDYLKEILGGFGQRDRLATSADYQQVARGDEPLAPGERSAWCSDAPTKKCGPRSS